MSVSLDLVVLRVCEVSLPCRCKEQERIGHLDLLSIVGSYPLFENNQVKTSLTNVPSGLPHGNRHGITTSSSCGM